MNKEGNARSEATKQKINRALMYLLTHKSFNEIYVKDVCTIACINRSSFYEHYQDIKRVISAISGHARKINVVMPLLYQARQHKRKGRESLDCAIALQELRVFRSIKYYNF